VGTGVEALAKMGKGRTTALVNAHVTPTADFASNPDLDLSFDAMANAVREACGEEGCHPLPATELATALMGDAIYTNPFLLGYAFQLGQLPVSRDALYRAIELNGRAVEQNRQAFAWGRLAAHDLAAVEEAARPGRRDSEADARSEALEELVAKRVAYLTAYQSGRYAKRYRKLVDRVAAKDAELGAGGALARAVARYYFKVMAIKDEYEVARLFTDGSFQRQLDAEFEGDYRVEWHAAPPKLPLIDRFVKRVDPATGRTRKTTLGPWMFRVLAVMKHLKFLRNTPLDIFRNEHRKLEHRLVGEYEERVQELLAGVSAENLPTAIEIASIPEHVRGFDIVKEQQLAEARVKEAELLDAFRRTAG
jgi:indolepyruvate ferredoxin oxidoreductase